mgnify:CR=1 FL=1
MIPIPLEEPTKKELTREQYHKALIGKVPKKWHKEMLEEFDKDGVDLEDEYRNMTRKELESKLMEMPETLVDLENKEYVKDFVEIHDHLDIQSSMVYKNRFCLGGMNEENEYITIWFDSFKFLEHVDKERLEEIKEKLVKYIEEK